MADDVFSNQLQTGQTNLAHNHGQSQCILKINFTIIRETTGNVFSISMDIHIRV